MTGDDAYILLTALLGEGDDLDKFVRSFDYEYATAQDISGLIKTQREERDHLLNQLAAVRKHLAIVAAKRAYAVNPWIHADVQTLQRLAVVPDHD